MQIIVTILSDLAGRAACHPSLACSLVPSTPTATSRVLSHVCRRPAIPASGCSSARGSGPGDERAHVCRAHFDARLAQFVSFRYSFQAQQTICVQVQEGRRLCNCNETNTGAQGEESLGLFVIIDGSVSVHRSPPQHMQRKNLHSDADMTPSVAPAPRDHPVHEQGFVQCVVVVAAFGLCITAALTQVLSQRVAGLGRIIWRQ